MPVPRWTRRLSNITTMSLRRRQRRNQAVFDIGEEHLSGHGTFDHHRGDHFIVTQSGHEGDRLPSSKRNGANHPDATQGFRPLSLTMFVLTAVLSINTSRAGSSIPCSRIQRRRARATSLLPFGCFAALFLSVMLCPVEKTPERAAAGFPVRRLQQFCNRFYQGQVRPLGDQIQNLDRELFQRRNPPAARLRGGAPLLIPALQPLYRRRHADLETRSAASRRDAPVSTAVITLSRRSRE